MVSSPFLNASLDVPSVPGIAASGASAASASCIAASHAAVSG